MKLEHTVDLMLSADYQDRFVAEYMQTKIRYEKLHRMCVKYEAGTLDFKPNCSLEVLQAQKAAMMAYLWHLEVRAELEDIDLEDACKYAAERYSDRAGVCMTATPGDS